MSEISAVVTAICAVLGLFGGFWVWFHNIAQSRMPFVHFQVKSSAYDRNILIVKLIPQRIDYAYQVENIRSSLEIYSKFSGVDILGNGKMKLENPLSLSERQLIVPSKNQVLDDEKIINFYIDLRNCPRAFHRIQVDLKSQYFPWKWARPIDVPVC
ncbi:hypothetical protein [Conservatibacter flavescens]|uniref:Uncharacterized protein n=1 Tax=Conservatibacter flavescens TaxID=28161 RepID=A0A2M8S5Q5_9PAST|nr:hypothetical protein [Conservatibacter flavescens]PJG86438.1 hypothetical protein CVP05_01100 [Conservatibacter flavescens]